MYILQDAKIITMTVTHYVSAIIVIVSKWKTNESTATLVQYEKKQQVLSPIKQSVKQWCFN